MIPSFSPSRIHRSNPGPRWHHHGSSPVGTDVGPPKEARETRGEGGVEWCGGGFIVIFLVILDPNSHRSSTIQGGGFLAVQIDQMVNLITVYQFDSIYINLIECVSI